MANHRHVGHMSRWLEPELMKALVLTGSRGFNPSATPKLHNNFLVSRSGDGYPVHHNAGKIRDTRSGSL